MKLKLKYYIHLIDFLPGETPDPEDLTSKFYQTFKEDNTTLT